LVYLIIIPLSLGITYFIVLPLITGGKTEISTIGVDGEIYRNYITNYLVFIPIFLVNIISLIKNKIEIRFSTILFISSIIFAAILLLGKQLGIVSGYYFFKSYYIIWPLAIYSCYAAIKYLLEEKSIVITIFVHTYIGIYVTTLIITTLLLKTNIGIGDIFYKNMTCIQNEEKVLEYEELKINQQVARETEIYDDIYILSPKYYGRANWLSVLYNNQQIYIDFLSEYSVKIEKWISEKKQKYYLGYHRDYIEITEEDKYLDKYSNEYKIINNDEYAFILERK